jgi:hypothetical protein
VYAAMTEVYPTNYRKYTGKVTKIRNAFVYIIKTPTLSRARSFKTKDEAKEALMAFNIETGLRIKNMVYAVDGYYEVDVKGFQVKFDIADLELVNARTWSISGDYVGTKVEGKIEYLHRVLMPNDDPCLVVDHINGDNKDNRKSNLRLVSYRINSINRKIKINNTSGFVGVIKDGSNYWTASWHEENRRRYKKFSIVKFGEEGAKQMAIDYRNHVVSTLPDYVMALIGR